MFSSKAMENAEACRFCWMCRHICPVGQVTGKETNNARAKGLLVSMSNRNEPLDIDAMEVMYQCAVCKSCNNDCASGYEPNTYILEARTQAVVDDMVPKAVKPVIDRALAGALYTAEFDAELAEVIKAMPEEAKVMLYLGEQGRKEAAVISKALIELLKKAGVEAGAKDAEPATGAQLSELIGLVEEVKKEAEACKEAFKGAETIVVLDPSDAAFMKQQWAAWGLEAPVVTATDYVNGLIKAGKLAPKKVGKKAAYHDPCRLARDLEEIAPAREILGAMDVEIHEMFLKEKLTRCCGGAVLSQTYPEIAVKMAARRWDDVTFGDQNALVTACPCCYVNMKAGKPEGVEVEDIFVLLNSVC